VYLFWRNDIDIVEIEADAYLMILKILQQLFDNMILIANKFCKAFQQTIIDKPILERSAKLVKICLETYLEFSIVTQ
jgi:hypothetical protein